MHQNSAIPNLLFAVIESTSKHVITFDQWHMEQFILHCHQLSLFTLPASPSVFTYQTRVLNKTLEPKRGNRQMKDGENYIMGNFINCSFNKHYQDDQIRKI